MSAQPAMTTIKRILVGIDASTQGEQLLETAVELAAHLGTDLKVLFVEDQSLLQMGDVPFTKEIRLFSLETHDWNRERIQSQFRTRAEYSEQVLRQICAERRVTHQFQIVQGLAGRVIRTAAVASDLLMVGRLRRSPIDRSPLDSNMQKELMEADQPVLLHPPGARLQLPPLVLYDGGDSSDRAVELAARLCQGIPQPSVTVLSVSPTRSHRAVTDRLGQLLQPFQGGGTVQPVSNLTLPYLSHLLEASGSGLLIVPTQLLGQQNFSLDELLTEVACSVLLVPEKS